MSVLVKLRKLEATKFMPAIFLLPTDVDVSISAVNYAYALSKEFSGVEPNILLAGRADHFPVFEMFKKYEGKLPKLDYWSRHDFPDGQWCVGNFAAPTFFVGSPG